MGIFKRKKFEQLNQEYNELEFDPSVAEYIVKENNGLEPVPSISEYIETKTEATKRDTDESAREHARHQKKMIDIINNPEVKAAADARRKASLEKLSGIDKRMATEKKQVEAIRKVNAEINKKNPSPTFSKQTESHDQSFSDSSLTSYTTDFPSPDSMPNDEWEKILEKFDSDFPYASEEKESSISSTSSQSFSVTDPYYDELMKTIAESEPEEKSSGFRR